MCCGCAVIIVPHLLYDAVYTAPPTMLTSVCCGSYRDLKMENILLDKRKRNVKIVGKGHVSCE